MAKRKDAAGKKDDEKAESPIQGSSASEATKGDSKQKDTATKAAPADKSRNDSKAVADVKADVKAAAAEAAKLPAAAAEAVKGAAAKVTAQVRADRREAHRPENAH